MPETPEQIKHEYGSFVVYRGRAMPVALLADVGAADGKRVCIARFYCWEGEKRMDEATRLAWLLVDAIKMEAVTSSLASCPNHSFRVLHDEKRPCPVCALQRSVLEAKSHRAELAFAISYLLEQRDDAEDPDWDAAWQWVESVMARIPNGWAESMITQQRDRLAGAVQELLEALASEYGSDDPVCWPSVLQDAGDDAAQVLDGVRGVLRRTRRQFCNLGVGQAFYVSSAAFGTVGYEKIALQVMDEGRLANARLVRAEAVGVLNDFAFYEGDEFVEVEWFPELEDAIGQHNCTQKGKNISCQNHTR